MEPSSDPKPSGQSPGQQFFRYFQLEATALQQQMSSMENLPSIGGERLDAFDHCLAGISRLQKEVQDASSYTSAFDQKMYSKGIKALHEKLDQTKAALAPKPKFSFKSSKKNSSALSLDDAAELAMQQNTNLLKPQMSSEDSSRSPSPGIADPSQKLETGKSIEPLRRDSLGSFLKAAGVEPVSLKDRPSSMAIRKMSFRSSQEVNISSHSAVHIVLPSSAAHATSSGYLVDLRRCIVDMSIPTTSAQPFAGLTIKDVRSSLLICGNVNGSAHVTGVDSSILLVTTRQFRMHQCQNCVVYLHVQSEPIIEDCSRIRFAPLPKTFLQGKDFESFENKYDNVQDFNWLKSEPSPNWSILASGDTIKESIWTQIAQSGSRWSLEEILTVTGVTELVTNK